MPCDLLDDVNSLDVCPSEPVDVIALFTGMVLDSIGIIVLQVPVFLPALAATSVDMIWFGIIIDLVTEIGVISPPIGMNVFLVKSVLPRDRLADIFVGILPFIVALMVGLLLVYFIPSIATLLPTFAR